MLSITSYPAVKSLSTHRSRHYLPSFKAASTIGMSPRVLSKIMSSFMFEAKGLKVIDCSRKAGRYWEFSEKAVDLIRECKVGPVQIASKLELSSLSDKFPEIFTILNQGGDDMACATDIFDSHTDAGVNEVKSWLKSKGVQDREPVSLFSDSLVKSTVKEIEQVADDINKNRSKAAIKKAIVKNIPRHAVLKPSHAIYCLQNQRFALGDRVIMSMDVMWDVPFMCGTVLGDR
ncbi:hypothetical protein BDR07DRAFT_1475812 [Suillus spraguei]|nr:hypothetical protein BDR07DRAFT_1475812 [Suillus spraguei]